MHISVKDAAERLNISVRAVQVRCKKEGLRKKGNTYLIPNELLKTWLMQASNKTQNETKEDLVTESFSLEQYNKLQEVIYNYPQLLERITDYKNEIEYLRKSLDGKSKQMEILIHSINDSIKSIQQQNYLRAKDSGYDKE